MSSGFGRTFFVVLSCYLLVAQMPMVASAGPNPIKHVVVIIQENHTFDNYFGTFPNVNGLNSSITLPISADSSANVTPYNLPSAVPPLTFVTNANAHLRRIIAEEWTGLFMLNNHLLPSAILITGRYRTIGLMRQSLCWQTTFFLQCWAPVC